MTSLRFPLTPGGPVVGLESLLGATNVRTRPESV